MKKFKFNKNAKLFLSTLTVSAATAGILAACTPKPDPSKASESAKQTVKSLLENAKFQALLKDKNTEDKTAVLAKLTQVLSVENVNVSVVESSKTALGEAANTASKAADGSVFANLNFLKAQYEAKKTDTTVIPADQVDAFKSKLDNVETAATKLKEEIGKLPEASATKDLAALKTTLEEKINAYVGNTDATKAKETLTEVKTALKAFTDKLEEKTGNVKTLVESALALEKATKQLEVYINTDVAKFVEGTENEPSTALNSLDAKIKTLLGTQGKDLWNGDAPTGITTDTSTQIYQVAALLASSINAIMEQFKY